MPWNGLIIALHQASYTSVKKSLIASSVCGLVGLLGIAAEPPDDADELDRPNKEDEGALVVYGAKGGNTYGF